jgi:hypothetical protein
MLLGARLAALGIGLMTVTLAANALAEGASLDEASKEQNLAAQKAFEAADVLYDAKHFAEALTAFRASHDVVKSPNTRLMIARSLRELGRLGEAYAEAKATLAEAEAVSERHPRYAETARAAREDLTGLEARVGFLEIDLGKVSDAEGLSAKIGERSFDAASLGDPVAVTPGKTPIVVTAGDKTFRREVSVAAGSTQTVSVDFAARRSMDSGEAAEPMPPEPAPRPPENAVHLGPDGSMRTWAYVAGGAGVAGLLTFGVFGLLNNSSYSSLEDDCPDGRCPPGRNDDIDAGRRYQLIANVGLGVGIAGVAVGTTLFLLGSKQSERPQTALRIAPGAVSVESRF